MKSILVLGLAAVAAAAQDAPPAEEGFRALVRACKSGKPEEMEKLLPPVAGRSVTGNDRERTLAWRTEFAAAHGKATFKEAREGGGAAVVRYRVAGSQDEFELPLRLDGTAWVADAPLGYLVRGKALDLANGRGPAKVKLSARASNDQYGTSAFSFAHVTGDAARCLNRMDLWYCHNGELHAVADGGTVRVAADDPADVAGIPLASRWKHTLVPEAGGVYVVHCRREEHRDFYVKILVKEIDQQQMQFEWSLLAGGFGSPPDIHAPRPLESKDAPDGFDGLCSKASQRSKPEPKPEAEVPPK